jgi:RNA polymerase sigma-70 factor (ECF subfamily)
MCPANAADIGEKDASQQGDIDVELSRKRLMKIARRLLGSESDAEDAVQDAYLRWYATSAERVRSPEAWLVTVVSRICIDRIRVRLRETQVAYSAVNTPEPEAGEQWTPERQIELSDDLSTAAVALAQLTEFERAAYVLRDLLGYSYEEVAAALGKSQEASRQLFHRARKALRYQRTSRGDCDDNNHGAIQTFLAAMEIGDEATMLALLGPSVHPAGGRRAPSRHVHRNTRPAAPADAAGALRRVVGRLVDTWASAEHRSLMTLFTREMLNDVGGTHGLFRATNAIVDDLYVFFRRWQNEGRISKEHDAQSLAWQVFTPLVYLRLAYFHASATDEHVEFGKSQAKRHVDYFISRYILPETETSK